MKILMFTNTYLPHVGGVAKSVSAFAQDLTRLGHQVAVVAPHFQGEDPALDSQPQVVRVPAIQNFNGSDFSVRLPIPFALTEEIDRLDPDLIHSHHPFLLGDTAVRVAKQRELPLVFTHHTMYEWYTHYVPFDSKGMKRFVVHLSTHYANMCSAVAAPSDSVAQLLRQRGVTSRIEEIPTGIDLSLFASGRSRRIHQEFGLDEQTQVIGHVGRLAPEKNLIFLGRAVVHTLKECPQAVFLVVGDGPSLQELRRIFVQNGLEKRFFWAGKRSGQDLADVYAAMDLFAFASCTETQGLVLAEAMAASTPVVALDASGTREVVQDMHNGRLLPQESSEQSFARALTNALSQLQEHSEWRRQAYETAQTFSRPACAQRLAQLYQSLLAAHKQPQKRHIYEDDILSWDVLLRSLKTEWDLITQKTQAMVNAVKAEKQLPRGRGIGNRGPKKPEER